MKIYNKEKTKELKDYDLSKGYLQSDTRFVKHHEDHEEIQEESHYEVVAEYPNGGKDLEKIVTSPYQPKKEAWDEYEEIQVYIPFSQEELNQIKISEFKQWFSEYFDQQFKQSQWQPDFSISYDKYFEKQYNSIEELKTQAQIVRLKIKELENN